MTTTPKHTDPIRLVLNGSDSAILLDILRSFDPADPALAHHRFTPENAWSVIAKVALAAIDDGLDVTMTRDEFAALHCVVMSTGYIGTDVDADEFMRVESDLHNRKWEGGYVPRYMVAQDPFGEVRNYLDSITPEELAEQRARKSEDLAKEFRIS